MSHGMRPLGALLSKEEALARLLAAATPVARTERISLDGAGGRASAEDVRAPDDVPPFARSMMDGYAVRASDAGPRRIVGDVFAGQAELPTVGAGEAARIATGAPLPPGADAVARVEDTDEAGGAVSLRVAVRAHQSVEPAGSDIPRGELICARGAALDPPRLGLLASAGRADVLVYARPRVALFSTGDELLRPGEPPQAHRIYDSNSITLAALFAAHGAHVERRPAAQDTRAALEAALGADADLVVLTGGASAGAKDLVVDALRARGEVLYHGVRVKPGKPLLVGRIGAKLVIGLPGNPTSALSNACLFVVPALRQLGHLPPTQPTRTDAVLASAVRGDAERFLFLPVKLTGDTCTPTFKGSGALTSMAASDGWIGVPEGTELPAGTRVHVHAWW